MNRPSAAQVTDRFRKTKEAYRTVFMTPAGKIVMADLEERFLNRAVHKLDKDGRTDIHGSMVNEGARQCVMYIQNQTKGDSNERLDD